MVRYDALSGVGITTVKLSENQDAPFLIEISNPYIKKTSASLKSLLFLVVWGAKFSAPSRA
jgi:hypothetical protein